MKKIIFVFILSISNLIGQIEPYIMFDTKTGNYICYYQNEEQVIEVIFEPKTKIEPSVKAKVNFDLNDNNLFYIYKIFNSSRSRQRLSVFDVTISSNISHIVRPSKYWKTSYYSFAPIFGWAHSIGAAGITHALNGVAPDSSLSGFGFSSLGLPSINDAYFQGNALISLVFSDDGNEQIVDLLKPLRKFPNNSVKRKTISPKDPPSDLDFSNFLESIQTYNDSSFVLGWLENQQTRDKYNKYLTQAKSYLLNEDSSLARYQLQKVLDNCVEDSSTVLTSEAFALLYFNSQYLVNQLPEINITDMFDRLINEIKDCRLSGSITKNGIYNSLKKKVENSKKSYERGKVHSSVQKLKAFRNELRAQKDKHVSIQCTETLDEYSEIIIELLEE